MAKIEINKLAFNLSLSDTAPLEKTIRTNTEQLKGLGEKAGQNNAQFDLALTAIKRAARYGQPIEHLFDRPIMSRAYAVAVSDVQLSGGFKNKYITKTILDAIDTLRPKPSGLLVESMTKQYFRLYDEVDCYRDLAQWLITSRQKRNQLEPDMAFLLSDNGPKAVAERCISESRDFVNLVEAIGLNHYGQGRYYTVAQNCYYLEQLDHLKPNTPSDILDEIMRPSAYNAPYDSSRLLGHRALEILIDKAPEGEELHPQWEKVILAIGGDPRIPREHKQYRKWWTLLGESRVNKVRSWLSRLDLKIFLEILEQFALSSGSAEMQRMYPPRKKFLEGLFATDQVKRTRLFLSNNADSYAKKNYQKNELPNYSLVKGNPASIIALQVGDFYIVEGSHSCKLWIYPRLSPKVPAFNYNQNQFEYRALTAGMNELNHYEGYQQATDITHNPKNWNWQAKALRRLVELGLRITPDMVIEEQDLDNYLKAHGF